MKILTKAAKQRKESAELYQEKGRDDLAAKEQAELAVINRYLPKQLSEDEIEAMVKGIIDQTGASGSQDMGKVMGVATKQMAGQADGKTISAVVRKLLS